MLKSLSTIAVAGLLALSVAGCTTSDQRVAGYGVGGAALGALAGHLADYGVDDKFINSVKEKVTPGTSALFLLTSGAVQDKVFPALKGQKFEIIQTNLTKEQEDQLRAAFAED